MIIKYSKGLKVLEQISYKPEIKEKEIHVLWGVSGSGKSHRVWNSHPIE